MNESSYQRLQALKRDVRQNQLKMNQVFSQALLSDPSSNRFFSEAEEEKANQIEQVQNGEGKGNKFQSSTKTSFGDGRHQLNHSLTSRKNNESTSTNNQPVISCQMHSQFNFKMGENCHSEQQLKGQVHEFVPFEESGKKKQIKNSGFGFESENEDGSEVQFQGQSQLESQDEEGFEQYNRGLSDEMNEEAKTSPEERVLTDSLQSFQRKEQMVEEWKNARGEEILESSPEFNQENSNQRKMILQDIINSQNSGIPLIEEYQNLSNTINNKGQNKMQSSHSHSLYSDDQKKSVFLYSSSNDEFVQSQISQRFSQLKNTQNNGMQQTSSKQSLKLPSIQTSNFMSQIGPGDFAFKTNSSNFQLSDITMSIGKDNFRTMNDKQFFDTEAFEIKEEVEEEQCYTPMNQFYPDINNGIQQSMIHSNGSQLKEKELDKKLEEKLLKEGSEEEKEGDDSLSDCDYDDDMEEKCSLSEGVSRETEIISPAKTLLQSQEKQNDVDDIQTVPFKSSTVSIDEQAKTSQGSLGLPPRGGSFNKSSQKSARQSQQVFQYQTPVEEDIELQEQEIEFEEEQNYLEQANQENQVLKQRKQQLEELYMNYSNNMDQQMNSNIACQVLPSAQNIPSSANSEKNMENSKANPRLTEEEGKTEMIEFLTGTGEEEEANSTQQFHYAEDGSRQYHQLQNEADEGEQQHLLTDQFCDKKVDVVNRLYQYEKEKQQKIENKRRQKQLEEMKNCLPKPHISQMSKQYLKQNANVVPQYLDINNFKEKKRKYNDLKVQFEMEELKEVTGKPLISERAKSLNRNLGDLYNWKRDNQQKREQMQKQKEEMEEKEREEHQMQGKSYMSKESKKYIQNKENLYTHKKIEDRLLICGKQVNYKIQQKQLEKEKHDKELTQAACLLVQQKNKKLSMTMKNSNKENDSREQSIITENELNEIQNSKQRQNLYNLYYQEKKKKSSTQGSTSSQNISSNSHTPLGFNQAYSSIQNQLMNTQVFNQSLSTVNNYSHQNICSPAQMQQSLANESFPLTPIQNNSHHESQYCNTFYQGMINSAIQAQQVDYQSQKNPIPPAVYEYYPNYCSFGEILNTPFAIVQHRGSQSRDENEGIKDVYEILRNANNTTESSQQSSAQPSSYSTSNFQKQPPPNNAETKSKKKSQYQPSQKNQKKVGVKDKEQAVKKQQQQKSESRSRSKERKVTSSDANEFFQRNQKWSKEKTNRIENEQKKINMINSLKCTFRPQVSQNSHKLMSPSQSPLKANQAQQQRSFNHTSNGTSWLRDPSSKISSRNTQYQDHVATFDNVMFQETTQSQSSIADNPYVEKSSGETRNINIQTAGSLRGATQMFKTTVLSDDNRIDESLESIQPLSTKLTSSSGQVVRSSQQQPMLDPTHQYNYALALYNQLKH